MVHGPCLKEIKAWDNKVALIGDASHPLSGINPSSPIYHIWIYIYISTERIPLTENNKYIIGAFGSGAAFAMEDGWILARAIEYSVNNHSSIKEALDIFDEIRSPYYQRMYG